MPKPITESTHDQMAEIEAYTFERNAIRERAKRLTAAQLLAMRQIACIAYDASVRIRAEDITQINMILGALGV